MSVIIKHLKWFFFGDSVSCTAQAGLEPVILQPQAVSAGALGIHHFVWYNGTLFFSLCILNFANWLFGSCLSSIPSRAIFCTRSFQTTDMETESWDAELSSRFCFLTLSAHLSYHFISGRAPYILPAYFFYLWCALSLGHSSLALDTETKLLLWSSVVFMVDMVTLFWFPYSLPVTWLCQPCH